MIFDDYYDTTLWCIIREDKKNRKEIVNFLREIPEELMKNIKAEIDSKKCGRNDSEKNPSTFYNIVSNEDPNYFYSFQIDEDNALRLSKEYYDGSNFYDIYNLLLFPISEENNKFNSKEKSVINISYNTDTLNVDDTYLISYKESEYFFHEIPIGHFVSFKKDQIKKKDAKTICLLKD